MKLKASKAQHDADPVLTRAIEEDKVPWYKKPNLRYLYLFLFPTCMYVLTLQSLRCTNSTLTMPTGVSKSPADLTVR